MRVAAEPEETTSQDHAPGLEKAFAFEPQAASYEIERITGEVPAYVRGTYYLNGPGRFRRGDLEYRHWLDGDGLVSALDFSGDGVHFVSRYVQSAKLAAEEEAGRARFRAFGTAFEGDELVRGIGLASPVNVSIYRFAGRLLAFGEQGLPWELDPETLETREEHTFGRRLNPVTPFAAHPNFDPATGEMFNFGISFSNERPALNLYRFDREGEMVYRKRLPMDAPRSVHDFGLSPSYAVFYLSPYVMDMAGFMAEGATLLEALDWKPELGSRLLIASREDGEPVADLEIGDGYCLHLIGCFEKGGQLLVDVLELDRPIYDQYTVPHLFREVRLSRPARYVVDPEAGELVEKQTLDFDHLGDFPVIDPRKTCGDYERFWYLAMSATAEPGRKFFDEVVRCDWGQEAPADLWKAPAGSYLCGEPVFLPDPGSEKGAILCQRFDAETGEGSFLLFDAFDLAQGPVAELHLEAPIPFGFHSSYYPAEAGSGG